MYVLYFSKPWDNPSDATWEKPKQVKGIKAKNLVEAKGLVKYTDEGYSFFLMIPESEASKNFEAYFKYYGIIK